MYFYSTWVTVNSYIGDLGMWKIFLRYSYEKFGMNRVRTNRPIRAQMKIPRRMYFLFLSRLSSAESST